MKKIVMMVMVLMISGISYGAFYDDFEDGDFTNPTWTNVDGDDAIVADPIRPNNSVLRVTTDNVLTFLDGADTVPLYGFDLKFDYLLTWGVKSGGYFHISTLDDSSAINFYYGYEAGERGNPNFTMSSTYGGEGKWEATSQIYESQWVNIHIWHDIETDLMTLEAHKLSGELLQEVSFLVVEDFTTKPDMEEIGIIEGATYFIDYYDNIALVPEPASLLLICGGCFFPSWKRKA